MSDYRDQDLIDALRARLADAEARVADGERTCQRLDCIIGNLHAERDETEAKAAFAAVMTDGAMGIDDPRLLIAARAESARLRRLLAKAILSMERSGSPTMEARADEIALEWRPNGPFADIERIAADPAPQAGEAMCPLNHCPGEATCCGPCSCACAKCRPPQAGEAATHEPCLDCDARMLDHRDQDAPQHCVCGNEWPCERGTLPPHAPKGGGT